MAARVRLRRHPGTRDKVDAMLERRLLGLLGLGVRAGNAIIGVDRVRDAVVRGKIRLAVVAPDVSRHSLDKIVPLLTARHVQMIEGPTGASLGAAVGRDSTAVVGITNPALARGVRKLFEGTDAAPAARPRLSVR